MTDYGASSYHRFLQGDQSALEELVRLYGDALVRFAYCFLSDSYAAEDVMEDTFATLIVKRKKFTEGAKFKTYLFSIARNKCIDVLRAKKRVFRLDNNVANVVKGDPESDVMLSERNKLIYLCMQQLSEEYREVLNLVYFEGFDIPEVSSILHKSRKQVYNLLARAKTHLKEILLKAGIQNENL
ncbi:MAG: sigma-70 family RNA polymerase sigma factor [Clostridiales bacterium]|nr:sigma-70 family RNA polymerase sigma factor [Clostridiales bacterium]